jgi:ribosomal protein L37AE/L43A
MNMERKNFTKLCPSCGGIQTYTTKNRLQVSIRENWVCNKCSSTHKKKTYDSNVIDDVVKQYEDRDCVSKIALKLKIDKRENKLIKKEIR